LIENKIVFFIETALQALKLLNHDPNDMVNIMQKGFAHKDNFNWCSLWATKMVFAFCTKKPNFW